MRVMSSYYAVSERTLFLTRTLETVTLHRGVPDVAIELKLKLSPSLITEADQRTNERLVYRAMSSVLLSN